MIVGASVKKMGTGFEGLYQTYHHISIIIIINGISVSVKVL